MPRSTDPDFLNLLPAHKQFSTVKLKVRSEDDHYLITGADRTIDGTPYFATLDWVGEIVDTKGAAVNRVSFKIQNVDRVWGKKIADPSRVLDLSAVEVRRYFEAIRNPALWRHKWMFDGKIAYTEVTNETVTFDVLSEEAAAGTCVAIKALSPANGWQFPGVPTQYPPGTGINPGGVDHGPCFLGDTPIETPHGDRRIDSFREGWNNLSYDSENFDPEGTAPEIDTVVQVHEHWVTRYLDLWFEDGGYVGVTPEHPFHHCRKGMTAAAYLKIGDPVWRRIGNEWEATRLKWFAKHDFLREPVPVYNLSILKNKTYLANGFAVHNEKPVLPDSPY